MLKRWMLGAVVALVVGWMPAGVCLATHRTVVCESTDGYYHHCPAEIDGEVSLSRKLSQSPCEFDKSWGYDWKGIWVDDGCRGEFELTASSAPGPSQPSGPSPSSSSYPSTSTQPDYGLVVCESINNQRRHCDADTREGVELERQLSRTACVKGQNWDYDSQGIWVNGGCRARFRVARSYGSDHGGAGGSASVIRCESRDGRRKYCAADTRGGVELARQLGRYECRRGSTWDYDGQGIWVDRGCQAEFRLGAAASGGLDSKRLLRCESRGQRVVECGADTSAGVCLERQLSRVECIYGVNWGISRDKIWVDEGCGGEFLLGRTGRSYP